MRIAANSLVAVGLLFAVYSSALALDLPKPGGFVNDFANILTPQEEATLTAQLQAFEDETSNQIALAIVPSFEGLEIFDYSQALFTKWGIGQSERDNGILILMGPKEGLPFPARGDIFINVGRGLEGALPDSLTGTIIRNEVIPYFKAGDVAGGLTSGITAITEATRGEYTNDRATGSSGGGLGELSVFLIYGGLFFLSWLASFLGRSKSWWLGGVLGGAAGGGVAAFLSAGLFGVITGAMALGIMGSLFDFIVSRNYAARKAKGLPTDFFRSGGGFWGGRGGSGGFGGGFGGFGGGSSGGGGSGGGW
ncbi:hypothetical protein CO046_02995 [Candidatus Peregrinibacteria bacterium CG_4_9_14_0_2_um_filter_53_11]|nr:MAG: hypothetical protein CO046_02995 [Candidatus Peregrinibacteria bacterium CG_4_9_14_0_2_um_filter_53_11]